MNQLGRATLPFVRQRGRETDSGAGEAAEAIRGLAAGNREGRRRSRRNILAASGAVVVCAVGFAWSASAGGQRIEVLALARPVTAGQVIAASDLVRVLVPPHTGVVVFPASQEGRVVGQRAAESLWAGALLAPQALAGADPGVGNGVLALEVKEGRYPPTLAAGQSVAVYDAGSDGSPPGGSSPATASAAVPVQATVLSVSSASEGEGEGEGAAVVLVRTDAAGAGQLAVEGDPSLVQVSAGGR